MLPLDDPFFFILVSVRYFSHFGLRIPEFSALWKDILYKPQSLSPQFTGICWFCLLLLIVVVHLAAPKRNER